MSKQIYAALFVGVSLLPFLLAATMAYAGHCTGGDHANSINHLFT